MASLISLSVGILGLIAIVGSGRLLIRPLPPLALHWYIALATLAGFALISVSAQCLAMAGSGRSGFRALGLGIVAIGTAGHWIGHRRYFSLPLPQAGPPRTFALSVLGMLFAPLALISLAPSTKIDELYYHMLVGRRILQDHGLRVYQLPCEQAIVPQMGYQIAETLFHATNTADAGNVISLGFAIVLWLMVYGVVVDETQRAELGLLAAAACALGLYPAVWYETAGAHALGDLATFTAVAALFSPAWRAKTLDKSLDKTRAFACVLGAVLAASTKISLLPVALLITAAVLFQLSYAARQTMGAVAAGLWLLVMGPLVIWTYIHTGSPFGAAFAQFFGQTAYQPAVLQALENSRKVNQTGLPAALYDAVQLLNGGSIALILCGIVACCRQWKRLAGLLWLFVLQIALIAKLLPHEVRFLGGLQYGLLAIGAISLRPFWRARVPFTWGAVAALFLLGPWFAAELYYTRPFAGVALGTITRQNFLKRYVPFMDDFGALNKILPRDATLYVPNSRMPAAYAPRPVVFTLADWDQRTPLYRLLVQPSFRRVHAPALETQTGLTCNDVVYRNLDAVVVAYRNPNRRPILDTVVVQRCFADTGAGVKSDPQVGRAGMIPPRNPETSPRPE